MTLKEAFVEIRAKIENPANWIQEDLAQDKNGKSVSIHFLNAFRYCLLGAIRSVVVNENSRVDVVEEIHKDINDDSIATYNDTHEHKDIINLLNNIINRL